MIKSSQHLFRLLTLLIVMFMLPVSSLEVEMGSNSHRIIQDPNDYGQVELFVICEVSWSSNCKSRGDLPVWRCRR